MAIFSNPNTRTHSNERKYFYINIYNYSRYPTHIDSINPSQYIKSTDNFQGQQTCTKKTNHHIKTPPCNFSIVVESHVVFYVIGCCAVHCSNFNSLKFTSFTSLHIHNNETRDDDEEDYTTNLSRAASL